MNEHQHQMKVIEWAFANEIAWPDLCWLYAIANAGAGAQRGQAGKMKAEGVKPGVPDLCLPVPRAGFHGLYIEMKAIGGVETREQKNWLFGLRELGYYTCTAYGHEIAIQIIQAYIARPHFGTELFSERMAKPRCRIAASILPLRQCMLEEDHEPPCIPDDRPRISNEK